MHHDEVDVKRLTRTCVSCPCPLGVAPTTEGRIMMLRAATRRIRVLLTLEVIAVDYTNILGHSGF